MLRFPYQQVPLAGPAPPSLPAGANHRWRPFVPVSIVGPTGIARRFRRALVDPGSDDTIFPLAIASRIGVSLQPDTGHGLRWGGKFYPLRFGDAELEVSDSATTLRWPAIVGFCDAPIPYRLLGYTGCLQFFDAKFLGDDRVLELEANGSFPGSTN